MADPLTARQQELARLRQTALNEGLPLVDRARAVIDRLWIVDDILSEELDALRTEDGRGRT